MGAAALGPTRPAAMAAIAALWTVAMPVLVWMDRRTRARAGKRTADERFAQ
jgi:hypothetical protein